MRSRRLTLYISEMAERLGVSNKTVYLGLQAGDIPGFKVGRRWMVAETTFEKWISDGGLATPPKDDERAAR